MTHDIQDLLNLIKELEERILELETICSNNRVMNMIRGVHDDRWYWDH